jgi:hypothetical protein
MDIQRVFLLVPGHGKKVESVDPTPALKDFAKGAFAAGHAQPVQKLKERYGILAAHARHGFEFRHGQLFPVRFPDL